MTEFSITCGFFVIVGGLIGMIMLLIKTINDPTISLDKGDLITTLLSLAIFLDAVGLFCIFRVGMLTIVGK